MKLFLRSLIFYFFFFLFSSNVHAAELPPGSVWQWPDATSSAVQKEGLTDIVSVSSGGDHSLALKADGTVWAWGNNNNGQLGIGTTGGYVAYPVQVKSPDGLGYLTNVKAIAAGTYWFSMALKTDSTVWVWGYNGYGARGTGIGLNGDPNNLLLPTRVKSFGGFPLQIIAIAAGGNHSLALKVNGDVFAWGQNSYGQIGNGCFLYNCSIIYNPTRVISNAISIAAGDYHSLVVKADGTVWGWGRLTSGQLGAITNGWQSEQVSPIQIPAISGIRSVAAKNYTNVTLSEDGTVFEWGSNRSWPYDANPRQIPDLQDVSMVAGGSSLPANGFLGAALKTDGTVWAWSMKDLIVKQIPNLSNIGSIAIGKYLPNLAVVNMPESSPTPTPIPKTPLVLIPGIGGSELKVTEDTYWLNKDDGHGGEFSYIYPKDEKVWLNESKAKEFGEDDYFDVLRMKTDGLTSEANIGTTGNLIARAYQEAIDFFTSNGYESGKDLFVFPYDWRKDILLTASLLDQKIESIKTQTGSQKVDIIAHSMGGLVARNYISDATKAQNVGKLFTLGTPHLGSVKTIKQLIYGDCLTPLPISLGPACLGIIDTEIKDVLRNMISGYELVPSQTYFNFYSGEDNNYPYPYRTEAKALNYSGIKTLLTDSGYNTPLFIPSETFHSLDNNLSNTNGVDVTLIAGSGQPTLGQIIEESSISLLGLKSTKKNIRIINGDKTVPLFSASLNDSDRGISLLGKAKVFYTNQDHSSLVASGSALDLVENILTGKSQLPEKVSDKAYQLPLVWRLFSVHSPVSMHIYDSLGNHTGTTDSGDFEANIPGSSYDSLGDAKFIFLPNDGIYNIKFEATDQGNFDFRIRKYENDTISQETLYKDIPLTILTKAETSLDTSFDQSPIIHLDEDGNGTIDQDIGPSSNLTGDQVYDETAPQTAIDLSGTQGNNNWYKSDAIITLSPQDGSSGSGVLKTEYSLDNGETVNIYTKPFPISMEGINKLKFRSVDNAGNEEYPQEAEIKIDKTLPQVVIDADPKTLWPPNNKMINVKIAGSSSDVNLLSTKITVDDEYGQIEPLIASFGQTIKFQAGRNGDDKDGRTYTVKAIAEDLAGNTTQALVEVLVPHDQRK